MKTMPPARVGTVLAGVTVRVSGGVRWLPTCSDGIPITPSRRGCNATANSVRALLTPLTLWKLRLLVLPLSRNSPSSGE